MFLIIYSESINYNEEKEEDDSERYDNEREVQCDVVRREVPISLG